MEQYQATLNRAMQTIAVIEEHIPGLTVGGVSTGAFASLANNLENTAALRDIAIATADAAANGENLNSLLIRTLVLALPQAAKSDLDEEKPVEAGLIDLLSEAFGITPRTTEMRLKRGKKVVAALMKINAFLAAQVPVRAAISAGGKNISHLNAAMGSQTGLEQVVENTKADETTARINLDTEEHTTDRLNKRYYQKLLAEARTNPTLATALAQIDTETDNLPGTLSIASVLQGGDNQLHLLVAYVNGTGANADDRLLDWMVVGTDADFTHTTEVDLSGNLLGPFLVGQTVKIRTRTVNGSGTRTSAVRTLVIQQPG